MDVTPSESAVSLKDAVSEMLAYFKTNLWFTESYWPENEPRVLELLHDLQREVPPGGAIFEPGCGNGYISFLAGRLGYRVTATDAWTPADREELFRRSNVQCFESNMNMLKPWPELGDESFEAVLFGEVFEHLLNHPLGVLQEIHRLLKPGGMLLLTTPNPSTLANALRLLADRNSLWGTDDFATIPEIVDGKVIDRGEIHYREYRASELRSFLERAGFTVETQRYVGTGLSPKERPLKKIAKRMIGPLIHQRLFATSNYIIARKR